MRVLITGGAGFIGSHLAERLLARGDQVALVDNFNAFYDPAVKRANLEQVRKVGPVEVYELDIRDRLAMEALLRKTRFDKVVHLAAMAGVRPSLENPVLYADVNMTGTLHLLELAVRSSVGHFIFGSSSSVYGLNPKVPFSEEDPIEHPISPYAVTKRAGELLCYSYAHNHRLPITCLRLFTVYGPRQRPEMAIHKFARLISQGKAVPVFGDGSSRRDYTYIDDILQGLEAALERVFPFEIINLGNSHTTELRVLIQHLETHLEKKARLEFQPEQPGDVPVTCADVRKGQRLLGYRPQVDIEEGIARFVAWLRSAMAVR
ncbi:MAG: SDR family NAD(P)-dependent oxidoreductase [Acidobacteria bacterium]|nr:SDR family NAD(P)-dependent oxidoreductase [Acidobacteriota bacterium]